jgi:hypothetical protein
METTRYISRHVVAALKQEGLTAYTTHGTPGFKVYSFHGGPAMVQCYGARSNTIMWGCLAAYETILTSAGFVTERHGHYLKVTGRNAQ